MPRRSTVVANVELDGGTDLSRGRDRWMDLSPGGGTHGASGPGRGGRATLPKAGSVPEQRRTVR